VLAPVSGLGRCNHLCVTWQWDLRDELIRRLPESAAAQVLGSAANASQLDGWSDLDLHVDLTAVSGPVDLLAGCQVWALSEDRSAEQQTLRIVLEDGRRLDLVVKGGVIRRPAQADDNDVRMMAALAAAKLGRGDHLIGLHLTLELIRSSLVQAMLLRDRDLGTNVHRFGSQPDVLAKEIAELLHNPLDVVPRPNIVEKTVEMCGRWRCELDPGYRPDWSGLDAVISRGLHHQ
jgi:hypothetical protein